MDQTPDIQPTVMIEDEEQQKLFTKFIQMKRMLGFQKVDQAGQEVMKNEDKQTEIAQAEQALERKAQTQISGQTQPQDNCVRNLQETTFACKDLPPNWKMDHPTIPQQ